MREILEDAAIIYRHEAETLLIITAPALVIGPVCVLIASAGVRAAIATIPAFLLVYLLTYAANLRAAKLVFDSEAPDPARAYVGVVIHLPAIIVASAPVALLMAAAAASAFVISNEGFALVAFGTGLGGALMGLFWLARHIYDLPLVLGYGAGGFQALRRGVNVLETAPTWSARVSIATTLPLIVVWLFCWGLWVTLAPAFGAAIFAAAAALWLPFAALSLTNACTRLVSEMPSAKQPAA